jgi:hypothetical protein
MCISHGDNTSPVAEDRISRVWVPRLPLEMRHLHRRSPKFWICDTAEVMEIRSYALKKGVISAPKSPFFTPELFFSL